MLYAIFISIKHTSIFKLLYKQIHVYLWYKLDNIMYVLKKRKLKSKN